jgi:predicted  nucleic acid-binding Zn-ribbon protein
MREIHRLRSYARDLQDRINRGPIQLRAHQGNVARQEEALLQGHEEIKKLKITIRDKEGTLKTKNQDIVKHEKQLNQAASKKEYDALKAEIASDRKAVSQLEDEILEAMGAVEEKTARLPEMEKAVKQAKADLAAYESESGARLAALAEERAKALRQLAEVEVTVPADVREVYERMTRKEGEDALAPVVNRTCATCYTEITAQGYNELLAEQFVQCKSCGRILYLPAE